MENKENTPNPEQESFLVQEENSSPVALTEPDTNDNPPTESNQTEEQKKEEFPPQVSSSHIKEEHLVQPGQHEDELTDEAAEHEIHESEEDFDRHTRAELVTLLEQAVADPDINVVKTRIALIKVTFMKKTKEENLRRYETVMEEGGSKEELEGRPDELEERFNEVFNIYKANKLRYNEEQEKIKNENLQKKLHILEELRTLINSEETLKKTYDEFRILQDRWKEIGIVPRTEINNLWQNYHFLVEKFFEKVKLNKELKDLDLKKNLEAKIALCEKTEELLLETSIIKSFKQLQKFHEEWKEIGPTPADKKDEIWERFKTATDKINERRREHYARIEEDQQKNLETKNALCDQAEEVLTLKNETTREWQDHTNKINELLKIWKSVGPVPQKTNAAIWARFKTCLDTFFANKKEFFDKLKEQQLHNYNLKVDLCVQAEAIRISTDWKKTTNEMIRLQNEWKKIGPVPRKHSERIWKRFRVACDEFFNAKSSYFANIHTHEEENMQRKVDLMNRLKVHDFTDDKNANLEVLKNFQREWTEIGHVPIRDRDRLQNEFRGLINERLDKLQINALEISTASYQTRLDQLKNDPQSRRLINREREQLMSRIAKMKDDINLWENNIGFLASSKNADILKVEFGKKIDRAKSELKVMEAKLKMIRQQ
jgi:hypothetical protein